MDVGEMAGRILRKLRELYMKDRKAYAEALFYAWLFFKRRDKLSADWFREELMRMKGYVTDGFIRAVMFGGELEDDGSLLGMVKKLCVESSRHCSFTNVWLAMRMRARWRKASITERGWALVLLTHFELDGWIGVEERSKLVKELDRSDDEQRKLLFVLYGDGGFLKGVEEFESDCRLWLVL